MNRRHALTVLFLSFAFPAIAGKTQTFIFKVKTKRGSIVGNVSIQATDVEAAKVKVYDRYPGCQILSVKTK